VADTVVLSLPKASTGSQVSKTTSAVCDFLSKLLHKIDSFSVIIWILETETRYVVLDLRIMGDGRKQLYGYFYIWKY